MALVRFIAAAIFFVIMTGVYFVAHAAVAMGFIPWLLLMAGIVWVSIKIENHDRAVDGRPPYSWYDAGRDVRDSMPVIRFWALAVLAAFVLTRFI